MPSPKKSPARSRSRGRSKSASRKKGSSQSRSRSSGRKPKTAASEVTEVTEMKALKKSSARPRSKSKSPSRASNKEAYVTKQTIITSSVFTSGTSSSQEQASVTPVRTSSRISSLIEKEKEQSTRKREEMKNEMLSNLKTPTPPATADATKTKQKTNYEFMGPVGTFFLIFLLPLTAYYVNLTCNQGKCSIGNLPSLPKNIVTAFFEVEATLIFLAWFFLQVFLALLPVGRVVEGQPLKSGGRLKYRCNGFFALIVSLMMLGAAVYFKCPVYTVIDKFFKLLTSATIFSFMLSIFLYVSSRFVSTKKLAPGGNTGNVIYDFFIGRELNPRIGPLDLKFFCELRPGLIGWVVLAWIMVVKNFQDHGTLNPNLLLVTVFQTIYVADALWFEEAVLTTMDIIHDGFGFMLTFGDLVWVPFLYCLQPRFLLESNLSLPWYCLAPIAVIKLVGYGIFRLSNLQKNIFRNDPKDPRVSELETVPTQTNKLLVGGWWGICRKPNYLGDLIMALSWSLTTGFGHILTYFYPIYFLVLLVHRERRDNEHCHQKYSASWDRYCQRVKYRIFPYIY